MVLEFGSLGFGMGLDGKGREIELSWNGWDWISGYGQVIGTCSVYPSWVAGLLELRSQSIYVLEKGEGSAAELSRLEGVALDSGIQVSLSSLWYNNLAKI